MIGRSACWCALPVIRGNTDCCKSCPNNPWKHTEFDLVEEWKKYKLDLDN